MNITPFLKEYQHHDKNARVYQTANGQYGVTLFDAVDDFNAFESFDSLELAERFAGNWVLRGYK